ncbi:MAG: DUF4301 family protein [Bacteroidales bacterium]|jgi:hypothetical protein
MKTTNLEQIKELGITENDVKNQINLFKKGTNYIKLDGPALLGKNIIKFKDVEYDLPSYIKLQSFIPASGAATRMVKLLYNTLDEINNNPNFKISKDDSLQSLSYFFENLHKFSFYNQLKACLANDDFDIEELLQSENYKIIIEYILFDKGLGYGNLPKALIYFHTDNQTPVFAFEEHLNESAKLNNSGIAYLHFTISPDHIEMFKRQLDLLVPKYEKKYNCKFEISYSIQEPSTNTIAVNPDNTPFVNSDGSLLFRPAGHGALIHNLNNIDADIITIKNIDNVLPNSKNDIIIEYRKKMIVSIINYYNKRNHLLDILDNMIDTNNYDSSKIKTIEEEVVNLFLMFLPNDYLNLPENKKVIVLKKMLDRPIRICGMVKNEGEPGGGSFVVEDKAGNKSLQIVESSQINHNDEAQEAIFKSSTHFNPVDIVCIIKDKDGKKYNLLDFVDKDAYFISEKSKDGKPLKALELPGLWNGAMGSWITIFAEVPIETFNPVKTVNDLLREQHIC